MTIMAIVISICILGVITFIYRFSFISNQGRKIAEKIPQDFLRLLAPSTFAAIIANNLLSNQASPEDLKQKGIVAVLALVIAYFTKSIITTLIFGLVLLYILQNF